MNLDIPLTIRRSTWKTPELRESAARLVEIIISESGEGPRWSALPPTRPGNYWYRCTQKTRENFHGKSYAPTYARTGVPTILHVTKDSHVERLIVRAGTMQWDIRTLAGEWVGPLEPPR